MDDEQIWVSVSKDAPAHVKADISQLWCDLMDSGIGAVKDYHDDGGFDIAFSEATQAYFDERENSNGFDENGELIPPDDEAAPDQADPDREMT